MYNLIIKWKDGHTSKMSFGVRCLAKELASRYIKNHGDNIINVTIKEARK